MSHRRKKALASLGGLGALVALGWLLWPEEPMDLSALATESPSSSTARVGTEGPAKEPPTLLPRLPERASKEELLPPLSRLPPPQAPVIEEIAVDKKSACFNEDVTVTVKARTPGGRDDAFLRYRVAGEEGPIVSLRRLTSSQGGLPERGGHTVSVFGRDGTYTTAPLPAIELKDCRVPNEFELVHSVEPGSDGLVRLIASPIGHNPDLDAVLARGADDSPGFQPVKYVWSFGDGTSAETPEATVVHDFGARSQATLYSYFRVKCEAVDAEDHALVATRSIELKNPVFEEFMAQGTVRLSARPQPAEPGADGRLTVPVRIWHQWATPITVKSVKLRRHRGSELLRGDERNPPSRPAEEELFVALALGASRISPSGIVARVDFAPEQDQDIVAKELRIEGETAEGWPVKGRFIAMRPELDPVSRRMLVDGEWRAKVLRARVHLKKADVSAAEVLELEAAGLYLDLPRAFRGTPPPGFAPPAPVAQAEDG